jgi:hypothetical protein
VTLVHVIEFRSSQLEERHIEPEFGTRFSPADGDGLTETTSAIIINSACDHYHDLDNVSRPA